MSISTLHGFNYAVEYLFESPPPLSSDAFTVAYHSTALVCIYACTIVWECLCASLSLLVFVVISWALTVVFHLIKINIIGFALHPINVFFPLVTLVFPFIPWDVWNWKPSSFSKVGSKFFFLSFFLWIHAYSKVQHALSLPLSHSGPHLLTLLFHFSFTSHTIHYIKPITCHCHANNLPSTEQAAKTQAKQDKSFSFIFHFFNCLSVV